MIPRVIYTAFMQQGDPPDHADDLEAAWRAHHPEWEFVRLTLDDRPVVLNNDAWEMTFRLDEPAASVSRLNILRYEVLARFGGVFIDHDHLPLRPIDELLENVSGFCTTTGGDGQPHQLSCSIVGAKRNHPAMWHAVRDLPRSIETYRGVWDQTGPGFLSRVIDGHGHFRQWVTFHWALFNLPEAEAKDCDAAFGYVADAYQSDSSMTVDSVESV